MRGKKKRGNMLSACFRAMKMCQIRASMFHRCYSLKYVEKGKKVGSDDSCNEDREIVSRQIQKYGDRKKCNYNSSFEFSALRCSRNYFEIFSRLSITRESATMAPPPLSC